MCTAFGVHFFLAHPVCVIVYVCLSVFKLSHYRDAGRADIWRCYNDRLHSPISATSGHFSALYGEVSSTVLIRLPLYGLASSKQLKIYICRFPIFNECKHYGGAFCALVN